MFDDSVERYLTVLFARARASALVEVRWRTPSGMARRFVPVPDRAGVVRLVEKVASATDVYVGVLPRWRQAGGRSAIVGDARTVWVDLDSDVAARALESVDPSPTLVVASGGVGHLHAYWSLTAGVPPGVIERANRRLAWALGGDLASTDAARILRPPDTVNHGRDGAPVRLVRAEAGEPVRLGDLIGGLLDPPAPPPVPAPVRRTTGDQLLQVEPERYVALLTGRRVGRSRKVRCPLHDDRTASLHVYREPGRGWFCFGCRRGGTAYDLAGAMWKVETRGAGFVAIRERLLTMLR